MKISYLKEKLLFTAGYIALLVVLRIFDVPCFFLSITGIACPGCGMTRAVVSALMLDFGAAFRYHFMFWSIPVLYLYFLVDGGLFKRKIINVIILSSIALGFAVNWIIKLV